jgi:CRP-like cAMP-binding protein
MTTAKHRAGKTGLTETIQLTLRRHPVFSLIRQSSWDNLLKQCQVQTLKAGQTVCREGEPARTAWLVLEGEVKLVRHTTRGQVLLVDITLSGEIFGAVFYRENPVQPATAITLKTSRIMAFPFFILIEEMSANSVLQRALLEDTCLKLCQSMALRSLALENLTVRIVTWLLRLYQKFGRVIPETRATLAELAGSSIESAIRVTRELEDKGLLRLDRGRIEIISIEKLRGMAGPTILHYHRIENDKLPL